MDDKKCICLICHKEYKSITVSHLNTHNITMQEYRKKFPHAVLWSKEFKNKRSINRLGKKNYMYGKTHTNKVKKRLSKIQKDWCSKYDNQFTGHHHTEKTKAIFRKNRNKQRFPRVSSIEFIVYEYLDDIYPGCFYHNYLKVIKISYNKRKYIPDIVCINNKGEISFFVEVNGEYWHTLYRTKEEDEARIKKIFNENKVLILWENDVLSGKFKNIIKKYIKNNQFI